jgi:hypothetical protein
MGHYRAPSNAKKVWNKLRSFRLHTVVLFTAVPGLLIPSLFASSLADFYKLNIQLTEPARRVANNGRAVDFYFDYKLQSLPKLLTHNQRAEPVVAARRWANDEVHISLPGTAHDALTDALPGSPDDYQKMALWSDGMYQKAGMRFRGDSGFHWLLPKKSFKLKTSKGELFRGKRRLHFSVKHPYMGVLVGRVAKDFDLLAPDGAPVKVFLNEQFYGIVRYLENVDEGFLRANRRMPGNIYKGEGLKSTGDWHAGLLGHFLLYSPYAWPKVAIDNSRPDNDRSDLEHLSRLLATPGAEALNELRHQFDLPTITRNIAFNYFVNEWHSGDGNNLRWYVDPTDGKFHPIIWDGYAGNNARAFANHPRSRTLLNHAYYRLGSDPRLMHDVFAYLYTKLKSGGIVEEQCAPLVAHSRANADAFDVEELHTTFGLDAQSVDRVCRALEGNRARILEHLANADLDYSQTGRTVVLATRSLAGAKIASLEIAFEQLDTEPTVAIDTDRDLAPGEGDTIAPTTFVKLGPGRARLTFNSPFTVLPAYTGKNRLVPARMDYGLHLPPGVELVKIDATNALTGAPALVTEPTTWTTIAHDSAHPWDFEVEPQHQTVVLDYPEHRVNEDWTIPANTTITIRPGTRVVLAENVTVRSFGKILAEGTKASPIIFTRKTSGTVWGVLALQGDGASGSRFQNVQFEYGSLARFGPTRYPGMVTVHGASDVAFRECDFSKNLKGDDLLRAAHSTVDVEDSRFHAANSDAIDFDYSSGTIARNHFTSVGNDCIDLMTSSPDIIENRIEGCGDKGISVGEDSSPLIFNNLVTYAKIGIQLKDGSNPLILHDTIARCETGIHAYRKNWRYDDGGSARIYNSEVIINERALRIDGRSSLTIESSLLDTIDEELAPPSRLTLRNTRVRAKGAQLGETVTPTTEIYALFNPINFEPVVGRVVNGARLEAAHATYSARFRDGFSLDAAGWRVANGAKLYTEGRQLKAELGARETALHNDVGLVALPNRPRVVMTLSATTEASVDIEIMGETLTHTTIDVTPSERFYSIPLEGESLKSIRIRPQQPTTVRITRLDVVGDTSRSTAVADTHAASTPHLAQQQP